MPIAAGVIAELEKLGYRACVIPLERLTALENEYRAITSREVWRNSPHLSRHHFDFAPPPDFPARSVLIVAAPVTPVKLGFTRHGRHYAFEVPPLSADHDVDLERIVAAVTSLITPHGYGLIDANVPTKLLASHAGLLENGYNNMGFIEGMGSFFRLSAFFSDMPPGTAVWTEHRVSRSCEVCRACSESCPTGCLGPDGYDVGRCLSLLSKEASDFPEWVHSRWHNSLIGCRICQQVCPMNRELLDTAGTGAEFSETETGAILAGTPFEDLDPATRDKLRYFHLNTYYNILPRNLRLLLDREQADLS
ncbi:4Fe-4S double cluster binding domain-containing protein [Dehalogenimonas sp. THU2]|uniref:4Fe-4S double cluster binding domain-containing protein n=1 Tax=Dehalogenimonas sp. THU2 TaxID=3151121 RepID=UPI003218A004